MNSKDKGFFAQIMAALETAFSERVTEKKVDLYFNCLQDVDIATLERSVQEIILSKKMRIFPTVGEIRDTAGASLEARAIKAWHSALDAALRLSYFTVRFEDPVIHTAILKNWGSWSNFTDLDLTGKNSPWLQKVFVQTYLAYFTEGSHPPLLPGRNYAHLNYNEERDLHVIPCEHKALPAARVNLLGAHHDKKD